MINWSQIDTFVDGRYFNCAISYLFYIFNTFTEWNITSIYFRVYFNSNMMEGVHLDPELAWRFKILLEDKSVIAIVFGF